MKSRLRANITCHKALFFGGASEISKYGGGGGPCWGALVLNGGGGPGSRGPGGGGACCRDICMNVVQGHREAGSWCSRI